MAMSPLSPVLDSLLMVPTHSTLSSIINTRNLPITSPSFNPSRLNSQANTRLTSIRHSLVSNLHSLPASPVSNLLRFLSRLASILPRFTISLINSFLLSHSSLASSLVNSLPPQRFPSPPPEAQQTQHTPPPESKNSPETASAPQAQSDEPGTGATEPTPSEQAAPVEEPTPENGSSTAPEPLRLESEEGEGENDDDTDERPIKRQKMEDEEIGPDQSLDDDPVLALADANSGAGASDSYPPE
ncbi:hypothetical protein ACO1O0_004313 [Amphichorda felina]